MTHMLSTKLLDNLKDAEAEQLTQYRFDVLIKYDEYASVGRVTQGGRNSTSEDLGGAGAYKSHECFRKRAIRIVRALWAG